MAWLKGLAGKAEDFLNQIDQNAAVVLTVTKEKQDNGDLIEVTWDGQTENNQPLTSSVTSSVTFPEPPRLSNTPTIYPAQSVDGRHLHSVNSSPNLSLISRSATKKEDELMEFLNGTSPVDTGKESEKLQTFETRISTVSTGKSSPFQVDMPNENLSTAASSTSRSSSRRESPNSELVEKQFVPPTVNKEAEELKTENGLLKSELRSFNNEMSLLLQRAKAAEKECLNSQNQIEKLQALKTQNSLVLKDKDDELKRLEIGLQLAKQELLSATQLANKSELENSRLLRESENSSGYQNEALLCCQRQLSEKEEELERARSVHKQELISVKGSIKSFELEKETLQNQIAECQQLINNGHNETREWKSKFEKSYQEVAEVRGELDQYRTRAQSILHDKDKLIAELRGEGGGRGSPIDDMMTMELDQMRQERELIREEAMQVSTRLQATREELAEAERKLEANREQAVEAHRRLQNSLQEEKTLRQAAEEDCRTQAEGLRSVREELSRQRSLLATKVRDRETELTKLRSQLSQRPVSPPTGELESRLHTLTQTLVQKQTQLEAVTTERNALRLQYEKLEHKRNDSLASYQLQTGINVNDTDDAKARVPSFLEESPFDTGVTRRVKRVYSNLDAVSIRTGVFLRRYPLARILMLSYMVLLHLWVMIVLFTYTPEVHPKSTTNNQPSP